MAGKHWDALSQNVRDIGNGTRRVFVYLTE